MTAVNATPMRRLACLPTGWLSATFQHTSVRKYEQQFLNYWVLSKQTDVWPIQDIISTAVIFTGVLISPKPDLLPDVFCLMVRIFHLMLVLLYTVSSQI